MAKPGLGDSEISAHLSQLERLSNSYKQSYKRGSYNEAEPEAYIDGLLGDMKDMRKDIMEAVRLGKRYIKNYESISHECLDYSRRYEHLEQKIDELTHEVEQSSRELYHKEARIELLEHEVNASEAAFKALNMENSKIKKDIKTLQREITTKEKQFQMKEVSQENQKQQMVADANRENAERIDRLNKEIRRQELEIQALFNRNKEFEAKYVSEAKSNESSKQGVSQLQNQLRSYQKQLEEYKHKDFASEDRIKVLETELVQNKSLLENMKIQKARRVSTISIKEVLAEEEEYKSPIHSVTNASQLESLGDLIDDEEFEKPQEAPRSSMIFLLSPKANKSNKMTFNHIDLTLKSFGVCNIPCKITNPRLYSFKICDIHQQISPKLPLNQTLQASLLPNKELKDVNYTICNIISSTTKSILNKINGLTLTITPPITPKPDITIDKKCFCSIKTPSTIDSPSLSSLMTRRGEASMKIISLPDIFLPPNKIQILTLNFLNEDRSSDEDSAETPRRGFTRIMPADTLYWFFTLVIYIVDMSSC